VGLTDEANCASPTPPIAWLNATTAQQGTPVVRLGAPSSEWR